MKSLYDKKTKSNIGKAAFLILIAAFLLSSCNQKKPDETIKKPSDGPTSVVEQKYESGKSFLIASSRINSFFAANYFVPEIQSETEASPDYSAAIQAELDKAAKNGGGVVYLKKGNYRVSKPLTIPENVTLRGDFASPSSKNLSGKGTVIIVEDTEAIREKSLIIMASNSGLSDLSIWYESQNYTDVSEYPYTIAQNGGEELNINNIALLNSYRGILLSSTSAKNTWLENIYITAFESGIKADKSAGKINMDNINISPVYWINDSKTEKSDNFSLETFIEIIYSKLVAIEINTITDLHLYNINIDTAQKGIVFNTPYEISGMVLASKLNITKATKPLVLNSVGKNGVLFSACNFRTTDLLDTYTVTLGENFKAVAAFNSCNFQGQPYKTIVSNGDGMLSFSNCNFIAWRTMAFDIKSGILTAVKNIFTSEYSMGRLQDSTVGIFCNNIIPESSQMESNYFFETQSENEYTINAIPADSLNTNDSPYSINSLVFNALDFGINEKKADNTAALQSAINKAYESGGGIVFIPEGNYKISGILRLRSKVRLCGVSSNYGRKYSTTLSVVQDMAAVDQSIYMEKNSSLADIAIEYTGDALFNYAENVYPQFYAISTAENASNIYIENINLINAQNGINLNKTQKVIIKGVEGTVFRYGINSNEAIGVLVKNTDLTPNYATETVAEYQKLNLIGINIYGGSDVYMLNTAVKNADYTFHIDTPVVDLIPDYPSIISNSSFSKDVYAALCVKNNDYSLFVNTAAAPNIFSKNAYHIISNSSNSGKTDIIGLIATGLASGSVYCRNGNFTIQSAIFTQTGNVAVKTENGNVEVFASVFGMVPANYHLESSAGSTVFMGNIITSNKTFAALEEKYVKKYTSGTASFLDYYNSKIYDLEDENPEEIQ